MSRLIKTLLLAFAGIVALVLVSAVALLLFFDPNDFKEEIAAAVQENTGREMVIEGDLSLSLFPWLAVEVGRTTVGNAEGFGDEPFARFDDARLSVRLLPLIVRQDIAVGTASIDGFELNLAVNPAGVTNWDDFAQAGDTSDTSDDAGGGPAGLDIANVQINEATIRYRDDATDSRYVLEHVNLATGRIALGEAFDFESAFDFSVAPGELSGHLNIDGRTTIAEGFAGIALQGFIADGTIQGIASEPTKVLFEAPQIDVDLDGSRVEPGSLTLSALGITIEAAVQGFSWDGDISIPATVAVAQFSLTELMTALDIEPPATADPNALQSVAFSAEAAVSPDALAFKTMSITLDDTSMTGDLLLPLTEDEPIRFDLGADRINLDRYMAPPSAAEADAESGKSDDFEIPVETIKSLNAEGSFTIREATFADMVFTNLKLGLKSGDGRMRLRPLSADLFEGRYEGDVRINAAGKVPVLTLNERVESVKLTPLATAMFEQKNVSGTINGNFKLQARGATLSAMRRRLNGTMSFELADGAWEGTDIWYQLRRARALYRQEAPPEPSNPPRTEFSSIIASGTVTDGVFKNEDLLAELPFMQLTGNGTVNLVKGDIDYGLQARVLERPEFARGASDEELSEFTEAMIPVRIRGTFDDPSVRPDIEAMFRQEVEDALEKKGDELKQRLLDRLSGGKEQRSADEAAEDGAEREEEQDVEDQLKNRLKDLFDQ